MGAIFVTVKANFPTDELDRDFALKNLLAKFRKNRSMRLGAISHKRTFILVISKCEDIARFARSLNKYETVFVYLSVL